MPGTHWLLQEVITNLMQHQDVIIPSLFAIRFFVFDFFLDTVFEEDILQEYFRIIEEKKYGISKIIFLSNLD